MEGLIAALSTPTLERGLLPPPQCSPHAHRNAHCDHQQDHDEGRCERFVAQRRPALSFTLSVVHR